MTLGAPITVHNLTFNTNGIELHLDMRYQKATEQERDGLRANFELRMTF